MKTIENRRYDRRHCSVPVDSKEGTVFDNVQTLDISRGGIGFVSTQPVPLNEEIAVEIELSPDEDPILVIGRVQWVRKISGAEHYRIGMKFTKIGQPDSKTRLAQHFVE